VTRSVPRLRSAAGAIPTQDVVLEWSFRFERGHDSDARAAPAAWLVPAHGPRSKGDSDQAADHEGPASEFAPTR
jgi:hypothetical protein